jgi:hypothetical protein
MSEERETGLCGPHVMWSNWSFFFYHILSFFLCVCAAFGFATGLM